jgi:aminoglycoside 3-N-acetyltransferase
MLRQAQGERFGVSDKHVFMTTSEGNMYTKSDLLKAITAIGINPQGTLLVHSSMKAIGEVEGRADTVLDAFIEYMHDGLLIFPTHSWHEKSLVDNIYNPRTEPSCVGLLTNLFLQRKGVVRSLHPTHSVAAIGKEASAYIAGEERFDTPCPRKGCWGKLYDRKAQILFLGCSLKTNTFIHGVEEWNRTPERIAPCPRRLKIIMPDGSVMNRTLHGHYSPHGDVSQNYDKLLPAFLAKGIAKEGRLGDAMCYLCDAVGMADLTSEFLQRNPDLFVDDAPIPGEWYTE